MQRALLFKIIIIALLALVLLIPLAMIEGLVRERQGLQSGVIQNIAASSADKQEVIGPILVVPYREKIIRKQRDQKTGQEKEITEEVDRKVFFLPETLNVKAQASIQEKYRGLYKAHLFTVDSTWHAQFVVPPKLALEADPKTITPGKAYLTFGIEDVRGVQPNATLTWNGQQQTIAQGSKIAGLRQGFHTEIGLLDTSKITTAEVTLKFALLGTGSWQMMPVAGSTTVEMTASWPHPSFFGRFLPQQHAVRQDGFSASWQVSHLATNAREQIEKLFVQNSQQLPQDTFGVAFIEPVNIYLQAERAVKYGVLFILLTFAAFFLFEILRQLRIHPLQYGLVGLALAIFFLLLVSLSEHIAFGYAYLSGSAACVILLAYYLSHVLGSAGRGLIFAGKLAVLYAVLYGLLLSEDNALVLGSILLFVVLAAVMILTRKIDWYGLKKP